MLPWKQDFCRLFSSFILIGLCRFIHAQTGRCEEGWVFLREVEGFSPGMCYLPIERPLSATKAKTFCEDRVSYLLNLDYFDKFYFSNDKSDLLPNYLFNNFAEEFWSGMYVSPKSGRLMWHQFGPKYVERDPFESRPWNWKSELTNADNTCGEVLLGKRIDTSFSTTISLEGIESNMTSTAAPKFIHNGQVEVELVSCTKRLPFVCEKPAIKAFVEQVDICPEGWLGNAELPYCIRWITEKKTYTVAEKNCQDLGGQLATVNNNEAGRNASVIGYAMQNYLFRDEGEFFLGFNDKLWVQGNIKGNSQGCLTVDFSRERATFDNSTNCQQTLYSFCTRRIIYTESPYISVDSVYLDKNALADVAPWSPLPLYSTFDRFPLQNEVVFLRTPNGILNSTNSFQFTRQTQVTYQIRRSFYSPQSPQQPLFVNVTLPRPFASPARKRRSLENQLRALKVLFRRRRALEYTDRRWRAFEVLNRVRHAFGTNLRVKRQENFQLDWSYIVNTCGYYSFGLHSLYPLRYVETDPVLIRYDESLLFIYLAKFMTMSWVIGGEDGISESDIVKWKLLGANSYVNMLQEYFGGIFREITPGSFINDDPNAVDTDFLYFKAVVDDVTYKPPEITFRVFVIPALSNSESGDREQSYIPIVEEYFRQTLSSDFYLENSLRISSTVACPLMVTTIESPIRTIVTIPSVRIGEIGYSWERCYQGKGALVSAVCGGSYKTGARWSELVTGTGCQTFPQLNSSSSSKDLKNLSETDITNDNVEKVLVNTANLTTPDVKLTEADVIYTAEILYNAWKYDGYIPVNLEDIYDITNNIIQADSDAIYSAQRLNNAANRIIRSVDELTSSYEQKSFNDSLRIVRTFVASTVLFQEGDKRSDIVIGLELESSGQNQISDSSLVSVQKASDVVVKQTNTAIYLPENLIKGTPTKLAFHIYTKTELFAVPQGRFKVNSNVAAAWLEKFNRPVYDLGNDKVTVIFDVNEDSEDLVCGFWDYFANEDAGGWKTDGCSITRNVNNSKVICECDHLTNFAVLIDLNAGSVAYAHKAVLAVITKIGLSLSIVGLGLTILTFLVFRHLRNGRGQQVLVNLSVAMLCSAVVFLVGMERTENVIGCKVVAILLHYFILVSFAWMLVEGILQYLRFVKVLGTYIPRFMLKTMIPAWGIPLIPVIAVLAINHDLYFGGKGYCWLDEDAMLYAFIIPVAVILFTNIVVFILIIRNLCVRRTKMKTNQSERKMAFLHMKAAVSVFVILGLTWVFGFLVVSGAPIVFSYVFAFFNAFQGFYIFLLFTAREKQIRKAWKKMCCKESAYKANKSGTDSKPLKNTSGSEGNSSGTKSTSSTSGNTSSSNGHTTSSNENSSPAMFMNPQFSG